MRHKEYIKRVKGMTHEEKGVVRINRLMLKGMTFVKAFEIVIHKMTTEEIDYLRKVFDYPKRVI